MYVTEAEQAETFPAASVAVARNEVVELSTTLTGRPAANAYAPPTAIGAPVQSAEPALNLA